MAVKPEFTERDFLELSAVMRIWCPRDTPQTAREARLLADIAALRSKLDDQRPAPIPDNYRRIFK